MPNWTVLSIPTVPSESIWTWVADVQAGSAQSASHRSSFTPSKKEMAGNPSGPMASEETPCPGEPCRTRRVTVDEVQSRLSQCMTLRSSRPLSQ
jgi:hypothetical protein